MFLNSHNERTPFLSMPFSKRELVDDLLVVIQNVVAETANVSLKILSDNCLRWKIDLSPNSPVLSLQYELKCEENESEKMIPVVDYKLMDVNSGAGNDANIKHESVVTFDERRGKSSVLYNVKQEMPELLLVENNNETNDRTIQDQQLKAATAEKLLLHSMNNFSESVSNSSGSEMIPVTVSNLCMVALQTGEEENENCDNERKKNRSERIDNNNGISRKKGKAFEIKDIKQQRERINTRGKMCISLENEKHHTPLHNLIEPRTVETVRKCFKCEDCGKYFTHSSNLTRHRRIHTGEKRFNCDICNVSFTYSYNLICHKRIHTGENPFKCEQCGKYFTNSRNLLYHKRTHTGEKPFHCNICNKYFTNSHNLTRHRRIHTGEKPFQCEECSKYFSSSDHLTIHKRIHTGEKPFKCNVCDKSFTQYNTLIQHERLHTGEKPFKCEQCGKSFTQLNTLIQHKRIHTGERPFKCDICEKSFTQLNTLNHHKRSHAGGKTFISEQYDKYFTNSSYIT